MLTMMGIFGSEAVKTKAAGVNIDLWAGLATLAVGAFFLAWVALRPLRADDGGDADRDRPVTE